MTQEEIIQAIANDKTMPFIQPSQLAEIVDFVIKNHVPSISNLDEAAEEYELKQQEIYKDKDNHDFNNYRDGFVDGITHTYEAFKAGAEWDRVKMMGKAMECTVVDFSSYLPRPQIDILLNPGDYHSGDKVKVIVIPEED